MRYCTSFVGFCCFNEIVVFFFGLEFKAMTVDDAHTEVSQCGSETDARPTHGSGAACGSLRGFTQHLCSCQILCLCFFFNGT